jgi:ribosomal protein S18 acetylase RimI-like enzyme
MTPKINVEHKIQSQGIQEISDYYFKQLKKLDQSHMEFYWNEENWDSIRCPNPSSISSSRYKVHFFSLEDSIAAFALFLFNDFDPVVHLLKIVVEKQFRHQHLAYNLLQQGIPLWVEEGKSGCFLEVESTNVGAIHLYEKCHFEKLNLSQHFYGTNKHCYKMFLNMSLN